MTALKQIENSALWAAYGDALGFITELADTNGLRWRTKAPRVAQTISWRRRIGGKFGVEACLPAGCYSDDTQLRLATSRAIRGDGKFDVEAFAQIELPIWLGYALGAGTGTKIAASGFRSPDVAWFSNFFEKSKVRYIECGGNGASMRIQPHVWATADKSHPEKFLLDVIRNAICTHGHLRGILGAVFHAICLGVTLETRRVAGPKEWKAAINYFYKFVHIINEDHNLSSIWLTVWQERTGISIEKAIDSVYEECSRDLEMAEDLMKDRTESSYRSFVEAIGGLSEEQRGSGTKTAIIAAVLSWVHRDEFPATALVKAANLLGSDTDTIATMAGAILGAASHEGPRGAILDRDYIVFEASRMEKISRREAVETFDYPDLFKWHPPRTQLDVIARINGDFAVVGLAKVKELNPPLKGTKKETALWQWLKLEYGQSIFAKRRENPRAGVDNLMLGSYSKSVKISNEASVDIGHSKRPEQGRLLIGANPDASQAASSRTLDELTAEAIKSNFDPTLIGNHLMYLATSGKGIEHAIAYASIIVKARIARSGHSDRGNNGG